MIREGGFKLVLFLNMLSFDIMIVWYLFINNHQSDVLKIRYSQLVSALVSCDFQVKHFDNVVYGG